MRTLRQTARRSKVSIYTYKRGVLTLAATRATTPVPDRASAE